MLSIWFRKYGKGECRVAEKFTKQNVLLVVELICTSVIFSPKRKSGQISDSPMTFELRPGIFFGKLISYDSLFLNTPNGNSKRPPSHRIMVVDCPLVPR